LVAIGNKDSAELVDGFPAALDRATRERRSFMVRTNYLVVVVAAFAAFVMSSLYYSPLLLGNVWRAVDPVATAGMTPSIGKAIGELFRTIIIALVLARLIALLGGSNWKSAVRLALWLWFGFSGMMWVGAIMWEKTPWQIAAIHSGDWLVKTVLIASILSVWRPRVRASSHQAQMWERELA
jgi:hypothetical protein